MHAHLNIVRKCCLLSSHQICTLSLILEGNGHYTSAPHCLCYPCSCSQVLCSIVEDLMYFFMMAALNWTPGQWLRISPWRTVHVSLPFMDAKMPWLKLCMLLLKIATSRDQLLYHLMQMFIKCRYKNFLPCNEVLLHLHDNTGYAIFVMRPKMSSYHCLSLGRAGLRQ